MRRFELAETAALIGASSVDFSGSYDLVSTDTRSLRPGSLFVALIGERFDAHEFLPAAARAQACAAVVSRELPVRLPQLLVGDTRHALGQIGKMNRHAFPGKVVGITGSVGKTGTKEMTAAVLGGVAHVLATRANLNNEIGVPLTLCEIGPDHRYAVIEMGAAQAGDIAYLSGLVVPDVALVTNVRRAHVAGMGSSDQIVETKGAVYDCLPEDGIAIVNLDESGAPRWRKRIGRRRTISWALANASADVYASEIRLDEGATCRFTLHLPLAQTPVHLQLLGKHQVANALAAAAVGYALGRSPDEIVSGLEFVTALPGRLNPCRGVGASRLIDDTYNANPGSVAAAIDLLCHCQGKHLLILGDMAELGDQAPIDHHNLGLLAKREGVDRLLACGPLTCATVRAFGAGAEHFDTQDALARRAIELIDANSVILVKGSRTSAMERVVDLLRAPDDERGPH